MGGCGNSSGAVIDARPSSSDAPTGSSPDAPPGTLPDAAPPTGPDPATDGPATVTTTTVSIPGTTPSRQQPATIFAPGAPGPHPLVIVLPGFKLDRTQYTSYAHHLATWGFVAIAIDYADTSFSPDHAAIAADAAKVIDYALAQPALAIAPTQIGIAGHSLGGKIAVLVAATDARIKAVVGWDPVDSTAPSVAPERVAMLTAPLAVVGEITDASGGVGGMPCAPQAENFLQFYAAAPAPAVAITVAASDHMDWVDDPSCFVCGFCTAGTASPEVARTVTRRVDVAWFRRHLLGDLAMDPWILNPPELATAAVTVDHR